MPHVTIEVPSGATIKDLKRYFSESERFKEWAEATNVKMATDMASAIEGLRESMGSLERSISTMQAQQADKVSEAIKSRKDVDITPLLKQNQEAMKAVLGEMRSIASRINALDVTIPETPRVKAFDVHRKQDRHGLPLIEKVTVEYG